ncbi:MAG: TonB terminal [Gammaproteobacteria bacterium]|jgi:TonB family protein|nr:TonB terminal [Gammaproteobacteria bacterium]
MKYSGLAAVLLHLALIALIIPWASYSKFYTLPENNSDLSIYAVLSAHSAQLPVSSQAVVRPSLQEKTSPDSVAHQSQGVNELKPHTIAPEQIQLILMALAKAIRQHLIYPESAQADPVQSSIELQFSLQPNGEIENIQILKSSGSAEFDQAGVNAVLQSSPIALPVKLMGPINLRLPISFDIQ